VFSPYYAMARRLGAGDPRNHCALNVVLYGAGGKRWALTERGRTSLRQTSSSLEIGPSLMAWDGNALTIEIDEIAAPLPSRLKGRVRLHPSGLTEHAVDLDAAGRHRWWPIAPCARVEVTMERPSLRWSGPGYFDTNSGDEPLERAFTTWNWSRAGLNRGTAVLYDVNRRDGSALSVAIRCAPSGEVEAFAPPATVPLPRTRWRVARGTRAEGPAAVRQTLEDTPFYARSVLETRLLGEEAEAMHESLSLDRFRAPWVQMMLPFRIPRALR
jgi:carotenoid 1,2-hydratase